MSKKPFHLTNTAIADFCKQLALLLRSGVLLGDGLYLLAEEEKDPDYQKMLHGLAARIENGIFLSAALEETHAFPDYVSRLLTVGERTGHLEETLLSLSGYYEHQEQLSRQLKNALTYPAILLLMMLVVIIVLLGKVLPVFDDVYASLGGSLTGIAGALLKLGNFLNTIMPLLCVLLAALAAIIAAVSLSAGLRSRVFKFLQYRFGDKGISRRINDAHFARALAMVLSSGIPLEEGILLAGSILENNPHAAARCADCLNRLTSGEELSAALSASRMLPPSSCRMLALGIRAGNGDTVMSEISDRLAAEATQALENRISQIEPALVLITSLLIGAILLAVMLPLMNIMKAIG